jgi:hypothetical protein
MQLHLYALLLLYAVAALIARVDAAAQAARRRPTAARRHDLSVRALSPEGDLYQVRYMQCIIHHTIYCISLVTDQLLLYTLFALFIINPG